MKDVEERSRKAHWYTEEEKKGLRPGVVASWVSLLAVPVVGFFTFYKLF